MKPEPTVFVVARDAESRGALRFIAESVGLRVEAVSDLAEFQYAYHLEQTGCLVVELMVRGSGEDFQDRLAGAGIRLPVIFVSAYGDVESAVSAMKAGAFDFIQKPFEHRWVVESLRQALETDDRQSRERLQRLEVEARLAFLNPQEREVMDLLVGGRGDEAIADRQGVGLEMAAARRATVLKTMKASSVAELVFLAVRYDLFDLAFGIPVGSLPDAPKDL